MAAVSTMDLPPPLPGSAVRAPVRRSALRRALSPVVSGTTWRAVAHLLLDLPIGIGLFTFVVVALSVSVSLFVLVVGPPLLMASLASMRAVSAMERGRAGALLGAHLRSPFRAPAEGTLWQRVKRTLADPAGWRAVAYCLLMLPWGIITFTVTVTIWSIALGGLTYPLYQWAIPDNQIWWFDDSPGFWLTAAGLASWFVVGALALLAAPWVTRGLAAVDRGLIRSLLSADPNAQLQERVTQLTESRDASVSSSAAELRRIERDLHDGAQQRLVSLAMDLGLARERIAGGAPPDAAAPLVARAHEEAKAAIVELRDLVRGIHPSVLTDRGLDAAISGLVSRCPVPVQVAVELDARPPAAVEAAAYFVVAEALTNIGKHSRASSAQVRIHARAGSLVVQITDDGVGGASLLPGGGLQGLADRVAAVEGRLRLASPQGGPTTIVVELPCAS